MINQVTIIGLGLIGGSLGLALNMKGKIPRIVGFDLNIPSLEQAVTKGAIHWGTGNVKLAVEGSDLIILAVPVGQMKKMTAAIIPYLKKDTVILDVGSTKENLAKEISGILPPDIYFIGGHPMAGSERSGIFGANPYLFENAIFVITPQEDTDKKIIDTVLELIETIGGIPKIMSPEVHDQAVAGVSHLPYIAAVSLVNTVKELSEKIDEAPLLAAGGFRDTTRISGGDAVMWRDIALSNQGNIIEMINRFQNHLEIIKDSLKQGDGEKLKEMFIQAKTNREAIPVAYKGVLPQVYELLIAIPDQPGMLSLITGSLAEKGVNISEIEVLKVREHQEGVIRVAFQNKGDLEKSTGILTEKGLSVQKNT